MVVVVVKRKDRKREGEKKGRRMRGDLFKGLPPPSSTTQSQPQLPILSVSTNTESSSVLSAPKLIISVSASTFLHHFLLSFPTIYSSSFFIINKLRD